MNTKLRISLTVLVGALAYTVATVPSVAADRPSLSSLQAAVTALQVQTEALQRQVNALETKFNNLLVYVQVQTVTPPPFGTEGIQGDVRCQGDDTAVSGGYSIYGNGRNTYPPIVTVQYSRQSDDGHAWLFKVTNFADVAVVGADPVVRIDFYAVCLRK